MRHIKFALLISLIILSSVNIFATERVMRFPSGTPVSVMTTTESGATFDSLTVTGTASIDTLKVNTFGAGSPFTWTFNTGTTDPTIAFGDGSMTFSHLTVSGTGDSTFQEGIIVNEGGGDNDSRIEGGTDENLVYVDAGNDRVGIGDSTPSVKLDVYGAIAEQVDYTW